MPQGQRFYGRADHREAANAVDIPLETCVLTHIRHES